MQEVIIAIINKHQDLWGESPQVEKINVGFTNTIYIINDTYIVKICSNPANEDKFTNEINFYKANSHNDYIPKLYITVMNKKEVPYMYEIIEKVEGVSLYNVWHTFNDNQREEIIKQLCSAMQIIHSNKGDKYDWLNTISEQYNSLFMQALKLNIFNADEQKLLEKAASKFAKYLESNDFVLVHNDLHFDNIIFNDGKIKIIDFDRSRYAPCDFELDIIYRMIRKPWKFASEETEKYTNASDYGDIIIYIEKYYPQIINTPYLSERLAIYDIVYCLNQLVKHPEIEELKKDVLQAAKIVALKDELIFENLKNPNELMDFMDINIKYGWVDKYGQKHINNLRGFREKYRINSLIEVLQTGLGTCIEQAKMMKVFFDKIGLENRLYIYRTYEDDDNFDKEVFMHCIVLFKTNDKWYHFEHSNEPKKGINEYDSIDKALLKITNDIENKKSVQILTEIDDIPEKISFKEFNLFVNSFDKKYTLS